MRKQRIAAQNAIRPLSLVNKRIVKEDEVSPAIRVANGSGEETLVANSDNHTEGTSNRPRVPLFVPPRSAEPSSSLTANQMIISDSKPMITQYVDVAARFAQFRRSVLRTTLFGIQCSTFGEEIGPTRCPDLLVILLHKSREDFDIMTFFDHISVKSAAFLVLDEFSWSHLSLVGTLRVLLKGLAPNKLVLCASGSICLSVLEAADLLRQDDVMKPTFRGLGLLYPPRFDPTLRYQRTLHHIEELPVYFETDVKSDIIFQLLTQSKCSVRSCLDFESFQQFLRFCGSLHEHVDENEEGIYLTQYSFHSSSSSRNSLDAGPEMKTVTTIVADQDKIASTPVKRFRQTIYQSIEQHSESITRATPFNVNQNPDKECGNDQEEFLGLVVGIDTSEITIWDPSVREIIKITDNLPSNNVADIQIGSVLKLKQGSHALVLILRRDDPHRCAVVRCYLRQFGLLHLDNASDSRRQVSELAPQKRTSNDADSKIRYNRDHISLLDLMYGTDSSLVQVNLTNTNRVNLRSVQIVQQAIGSNELIIMDASLSPLGFVQRLSLPKPFPGCLHVLSDYPVDQWFDLKNVKVEVNQTHPHFSLRLALDGFSSRCPVQPPHLESNTNTNIARSSNRIKFTTVKGLLDLVCSSSSEFVQNIGKSQEFRLRASIRDVFIKGFSYVNILRKVCFSNPFKVEFMLEPSNDIILELFDPEERLDHSYSTTQGTIAHPLRILVKSSKLSEIIPFVFNTASDSHDQVAENDDAIAERIIKQVSLMRRILDSLLRFPHEKFDFAVVKRPETNQGMNLLSDDSVTTLFQLVTFDFA